MTLDLYIGGTIVTKETIFTGESCCKVTLFTGEGQGRTVFTSE